MNEKERKIKKQLTSMNECDKVCSSNIKDKSKGAYTEL